MDNYELDYAYRQGSPTSSKRTMVIVLTRGAARDKILSLKGKLKKIPNLKHIFISEDSNPEIKRQKSEISSIAKLGVEAGIDVKPRGRGLIYNNRYYPHSSIGDLPDNLKLANTKTIVTDQYVAYQSSLAPLSNFYPCRIECQGYVYASVEQGLCHQKCLFAGDTVKAQKVMDAFTPRKAKNIAKTVICPTWKPIEEKHLEDLN